MNKALAALGLIVAGLLLIKVAALRGKEHSPTRGMSAVKTISAPAFSKPVVHFGDEPPAQPRYTPLQLDSEPFIQYPAAISTDRGIFTLSLGGSTHGDLYHHDFDGRLLTFYQRKGHGPGELSEPFAMSVIGDEMFISERRKMTIHVFDAQMRYRRRLEFPAVGKVVTADQSMIGLWSYRRHKLGSLAGHMLTLYDRSTGVVIRELTPVDTALFSLSLSGGAARHGGKIYAVTANTGMIDIIDATTYRTVRVDPHDGLYVFRPPESWEKWSAKHPRGPRARRVRAWQATFPIPVDIGVVDNRLVVLYARGVDYFYNVHDLGGALISRCHPVAISHPRLNGARLEGIAVDERDRQRYAYVELSNLR